LRTELRYLLDGANRIVARLYTWTRHFTCMKMAEVRCRLRLS